MRKDQTDRWWKGHPRGNRGKAQGVKPASDLPLQTQPWLFSASLLIVPVLATQLCPTLCDPMDYSRPGSLVQDISQARILEWVAIFFCRGCSWLRDQTCGSCVSPVSCIGRWILYCWATRILVNEMGFMDSLYSPLCSYFGILHN